MRSKNRISGSCLTFSLMLGIVINNATRYLIIVLTLSALRKGNHFSCGYRGHFLLHARCGAKLSAPLRVDRGEVFTLSSVDNGSKK